MGQGQPVTSLLLLSTTPLLAVHGEAVPVSKPALPSSCCAVQPPPPPPLLTAHDDDLATMARLDSGIRLGPDPDTFDWN